jgi:hypothetical protein
MQKKMCMGHLLEFLWYFGQKTSEISVEGLYVDSSKYWIWELESQGRTSSK